MEEQILTSSEAVTPATRRVEALLAELVAATGTRGIPPRKDGIVHTMPFGVRGRG